MGVVRIQNVFKENNIDYTEPKPGWFTSLARDIFFLTVWSKQALEIIQLRAFIYWMSEET